MGSRKEKSKPEEKAKIRVMVVDDHPVVREGLVERINRQPDMVVVAEAERIAGALASAKEARPDVAVVDISLGDESGLLLIEDLAQEHPNLKVVVLSMHEAPVYAERALRAGARGYVAKEEGTGRVIDGIRRVMGGEVYMRQDILQNVLSHLAGSSGRLRGEKRGNLTDRELDVLRLIGLGLNTHSIAQKLCRSHKTIEAHKANIKEKLELKDSESLLQYAIQWVRMEGV